MFSCEFQFNGRRLCAVHLLGCPKYEPSDLVFLRLGLVEINNRYFPTATKVAMKNSCVMYFP